VKYVTEALKTSPYLLEERKTKKNNKRPVFRPRVRLLENSTGSLSSLKKYAFVLLLGTIVLKLVRLSGLVSTTPRAYIEYNIESVCHPDASAIFYWTTRRHISVENTLHNHYVGTSDATKRL
jgi:hypothetical protein